MIWTCKTCYLRCKCCQLTWLKLLQIPCHNANGNATTSYNNLVTTSYDNPIITIWDNLVLVLLQSGHISLLVCLWCCLNQGPGDFGGGAYIHCGRQLNTSSSCPVWFVVELHVRMYKCRPNIVFTCVWVGGALFKFCWKIKAGLAANKRPTEFVRF